VGIKSELKQSADAVRGRPRKAALAAVLTVAVIAAAWVVARQVSDEDLERQWIVAVAQVVIAGTLALMFGKDGLALVVAVLAFGGFASWGLADALSDGPPRRAELAACPGADLETRFAGRIYDEVGKEGVATYATASRDTTPRRRLPAGCDLDFESYCIGQTLTDTRYETPSSVWFVLRAPTPEDKRWELLPAARVASFTRTVARPGTGNCPAAAPPLGVIDIERPRRQAVGGRFTVRASAPGAHTVGFAARYAVDGAQRWHTVAVDSKRSDGFSASFDARSLGVLESNETVDVVVAAVPCHALDVPSRRQSYRTYAVGAAKPKPTARRASRSSVSAAERTVARREACRNTKL
jgi:hypothetical protein